MSDIGRPSISWDRPKLERFKKAYDDTKGFADDYVFMFDDHQFVRSYAKYLIEYLGGLLA